MSFIGSIFSVIFGIFWTILAASMTSGAGIFGIVFPLFGVIFVIMGIIQAAYHYKNATGKNRFSTFDITSQGEEGDPATRWVKGGEPWEAPKERPNSGDRYCMWCGDDLSQHPQGIAFCPKCGREI